MLNVRVVGCVRSNKITKITSNGSLFIEIIIIVVIIVGETAILICQQRKLFRNLLWLLDGWLQIIKFIIFRFTLSDRVAFVYGNN